MVKAIFFDIDGTLVSFETHCIPASTIQVLTKVREKGIKLYIATGRAKRVINNLQGFSFDGFITMNGSVCYNAANEVIYSRPFAPADLKTMEGILMKEPSLPCFVLTKEELYVVNRNEQVTAFTKLLNFPELPDIEAHKIQTLDVYQFSPFFNEEMEQMYMPLMCESVATRWHPSFVDIARKGNTKALGIDHVLSHYGINLADCMAFGDGGNDIDMIQHVPIGIAMGNAIDELKKVADYITTSVDHKGIENALRYFGVID